MRDKSRYNIRWTAAVFAILLILTEVALRLAFGFGHPLLYVPDAQAGFLPAANQDLRRFGAAIHINDWGMRSSPFSRMKGAEERRVLVVGDSITFGTTYVDQSLIFTELLKTALTERYGPPVSVLNASAGGWAPENEYRYLASRGTFGADWVVFVINTNDLGQPFATFEVSPQFPIENPRSAIGEVLERYVEPRIVSSIRTTDPGSIPSDEPDPVVEQTVLRSLANAQAFAIDHGARFILVFSPTDAAKIKTPAWLAAIRGLRQWAAGDHVTMIDMTDSYSRHASTAVYSDGLHLRPLGHRLIAAALTIEIENAAAPKHFGQSR